MRRCAPDTKSLVLDLSVGAWNLETTQLPRGVTKIDS